MFELNDRIPARKIGWYLRAKMQLKPYKTRIGYVLNIEQNRARLDFWKERYGITDADIKGEGVNDVNINEEAEQVAIPF